MASIKLTRGLIALVDEPDYERQSVHRWCVSVRGKKTKTFIPIRRNGKKFITLHQAIMGKPPRGKEIDHINRNTLDNRRSNLRFVTTSQNMANKASLAPSGYRGVSWDRVSRKWRSQIRVNTINRYIGTFATKEEAARAYDEQAVGLRGRKYAQLNFSEEWPES